MYLYPEDLAILFGESEIQPWEYFLKLVKEEEKINNENNLVSNMKIEKVHEHIHFLKGNIHGLINDNEGFYVVEKLDNYQKFIIKINLEIFNIKKMTIFEVNNKVHTIKRNRLWFSSVVKKMLKFYEEIKYYRKNGIEKHPVYNSISEWNVQNVFKIPPKKPEPEQKISPKELTLNTKDTIEATGVVVKKETKQKTSETEVKKVEKEQKISLPKSSYKKENNNFKKKETKNKIVLEKQPTFSFLDKENFKNKDILVL